MRDRSHYIVRVQSPVEADAFGKPLNSAVRRLGENSTSGGRGQQVALASKSGPLLACRANEEENGSNSFMLNGLRHAVNEPKWAD